MTLSKTISLPGWINSFIEDYEGPILKIEDQMDLAISLSRENVLRGSGGPFGAAVFEINSGELISVGVNVVVSQNCSSGHAEVMALMMAQEEIQNFDLSIDTEKKYRLLSSAEPCSMCMGAIPWAGVSELVCAARDSDVRDIGFDEGHKADDWIEAYGQRGIVVKRDLGRDKAVEVLQEYTKSGGAIYNAGN